MRPLLLLGLTGCGLISCIDWVRLEADALDRPPQDCKDYLACYQSAFGSTVSLEATYGRDGTCWTSTVSAHDACISACRSALQSLKAAYNGTCRSGGSGGGTGGGTGGSSGTGGGIATDGGSTSCTTCTTSANCVTGKSCASRRCDGRLACYATSGTSSCMTVGGISCPASGLYLPCTSSSQCGSTADCISLGTSSNSFCAFHCSSDADCLANPSGFDSYTQGCSTALPKTCFMRCSGSGAACPGSLICTQFGSGWFCE